MALLSKRAARIVLLTGHHICHNPRAFKEAETLAEAGFEVEWLGAWLQPELAARDRELLLGRKWRFSPVTDWTSLGRKSHRQQQWQRLRRRLGVERLRLFGWESDTQLGYCTRELLAAARKLSADLYIAHSESGLWVAEKLARMGMRIGVDMEDWFAEDLLPEARRERPLRLLRSLEAATLKTARHVTCTSTAMSQALTAAYQCNPPLVIYNAFPWAERLQVDGQFKDRRNRQLPSIHWFSQNIGAGRGLEDFFSALRHVAMPAEVHLRGQLASSQQAWFDNLIPPGWSNRVFVQPLVSNTELLSRIAEHDIGLALEPSTPASRDVTVTNKILEYLRGGLAVAASATAGQREIARSASDAVWLYPVGDSAKLGELLNTLLSHPARLAAAKQAALAAAERIFNWELQAPKLVDSVKAALV